MKRRSGSALLLFTAFVILICQGPPRATAGDVPGIALEQTNLAAVKTTGLQPDIRFGNLPLYFIHNQGQADPRALFYAKTPGYTLWVTKEGLVFDSIRSRDEGDRPGREAIGSRTFARDVSRLVFLGANKNPKIVALQPQAHKVNYLKGNDPGKWRGDIPTTGAVLYQNLYKNIDLKVRGIGKQIEYDWIVRPGGDPAQIQFAYRNVEKTGMNRSGDLEIRTGTGTLVHKRPAAYQEKARAALAAAPGLETERAPVRASFKNTGRNRYGFAIGKYDRERNLIIDPVVLVYSTYLGGSTPDDEGYGIAVDAGGFVYVTGYTGSSDFPTLNGCQGYQGNTDVFVAKLDPGQSGAASLLYSSYLGGSNLDFGRGIAVSPGGLVYVTGYTSSSDFPNLNAYQGYQGSGDAFVAKLDPGQSGAAGLLYSTFLGGGNGDLGRGISLDPDGFVYIAGDTRSSNFPTPNGYQGFQGVFDAFVTKLDLGQSGAAGLLYSTCLGGSNEDHGCGIAVDAGGLVYMTGYTSSANFPTLHAYKGYPEGGFDAYMAKLDPGQSGAASLLYSTCLGGSDWDFGYGIALDPGGLVVVTGNTRSSNFPTLHAYQGDQGDTDAFVARLDPGQSGAASLLYSTYLGGSNSDQGNGIAVDAGGLVYVTGYTYSADFPTLNACQGFQGSSAAFVARLDPGQGGAAGLLYSTCLGGSGREGGNGIALDPGGFVYVTGYTNSSDFPTLNSYQGAQGGYDAFVTKLTMEYTVSAAVSGSNGKVSPAAQAVYEGEKATIHIFPAAGYAIAAITDNGLRAAVRDPYTVYDVREDHEVVVTFARDMHRVTAWVAGGNGAVSPASQDIQHGSDAAIRIRPDAGYDIASIADNDAEAVVANPYVIRGIDRDHAVEVRFNKTLFPPQLGLAGVRKTESAWIIRKDYVELTLAMVENASPMPVAAYALCKSANGTWSELNRYPAAGNYLYTDKYLDRGESAQYKLTALAADGTTVAETEILSL